MVWKKKACIQSQQINTCFSFNKHGPAGHGWCANALKQDLATPSVNLCCRDKAREHYRGGSMGATGTVAVGVADDIQLVTREQ